MTSSNRHWPSMFKSKPSNTHVSVPAGCDERSPEPKPRWNPKPEQIRILEAIFNSGMVNPPRDEIKKIRSQLQLYGQVGDANVFYWFQNRKSRSKHKLRLLQNSSKQQRNSQQQQRQQTYQTPPITTSISSLSIPSPPPSSSSSSSEKSSPECSKMTLSSSSQAVSDVSNSPTGYVSQTCFQQHNEPFPEPFFFPVQQSTGYGSFTQGFCFSDLSNVVQVQDNNTVGPCTSLLLSEMRSCDTSKQDLDHQNMTMPSRLNHTVCNPTPVTHSFGFAPLPLFITDSKTKTVNQINQDAGESRSTVFINGVACEVGVGPFNVRGAFGDDFVLIHSTGLPVHVNELGVTLRSLQHGASYYLVPFSMSEQDI